MQRFIIWALRVGLLVLCVAYVASSVEMASAWRALAAIDYRWGAAGAIGIFFSVTLTGVRLRVLGGGRLTTADGVNATLLTLTANIILPGRVGEVAKVGVLRMAGLPLGDTIRVILIERLTDLNVSASFALLAVGWLLPNWHGGLLAGLVAAWLLLILLLARPENARRPLLALARFAPAAPLRDWLTQTVESLLVRTQPRQLAGLVVTSVFCLGVYFAANAVVIRYGCGIDLPWLALVSVVCVGMLSLAVPAAPAGVGVYEAGVIWILGVLGVPPERALAAALASHAIQVFPILLWTGVVMLSNKTLRLRPKAKAEG